MHCVTKKKSDKKIFYQIQSSDGKNKAYCVTQSKSNE